MIVSAMLSAAERSPCGEAAPQYRYRQIKGLRVAQTKGDEHKHPQTAPAPSSCSENMCLRMRTSTIFSLLINR